MTCRMSSRDGAADVGAGAPVDAHAEGGMPVRPAVEVHLVGMVELGGVAVGGRPGQQDAVALLHGTAVEVDVVGDRAGQRLGRREDAEELFDGAVEQLGVLGQPSPLLGVLEEVDEGLRDERGGGADAARDEQLDDRVHAVVGDRLPVDLGLEEDRDDVVARLLGSVAIASVMVCSIQGMSTSTAWACSGLPTRWARTECSGASTAASRRRRGRASRSSLPRGRR